MPISPQSRAERKWRLPTECRPLRAANDVEIHGGPRLPVQSKSVASHSPCLGNLSEHLSLSTDQVRGHRSQMFRLGASSSMGGYPEGKAAFGPLAGLTP